MPSDAKEAKKGKRVMNLYERIAADVPALRRGKVWCRTCGATLKVDSAECLSSGWPKCCGYTMTIDAPPAAPRPGGSDDRRRPPRRHGGSVKRPPCPVCALYAHGQAPNPSAVYRDEELCDECRNEFHEETEEET